MTRTFVIIFKNTNTFLKHNNADRSFITNSEITETKDFENAARFDGLEKLQRFINLTKDLPSTKNNITVLEIKLVECNMDNLNNVTDPAEIKKIPQTRLGAINK